jgi:hypothetical protein
MSDHIGNCAHCGITLVSYYFAWCSSCVRENIELLRALKLDDITDEVLVSCSRNGLLTLGLLPNKDKLRAIPTKNNMPAGDFKPGDRILYGGRPAIIIAPCDTRGWVVRIETPDTACVVAGGNPFFDHIVPIIQMLGFSPYEKAFHYVSTDFCKIAPPEPELLMLNEDLIEKPEGKGSLIGLFIATAIGAGITAAHKQKQQAARIAIEKATEDHHEEEKEEQDNERTC